MTPDMHSSAPADRPALLTILRAELRENHQRLTDGQIDLIANVAVELRLTTVRLGMHPLTVVF